jgi:uncharacterized protein
MSLQKPILIGGLALSAGFLGMDMVHHALTDVGDLLLLGTTLAGGGYWWWSRQQTGTAPKIAAPLDRAALDKLVAQVRTIVDRLTAEGIDATGVTQQLQQLLGNLERSQYRVVVTGGARSGKTSLIGQLPQILGDRAIEYQETPALFTVEPAIDPESIDTLVSAGDLVLFVTNGDLTATEYAYLEKRALSQRLVLAFNQQDRYLPHDRDAVIQKIRGVVASFLSAAEVIGTSAKPVAIKVKSIQADGSVQESMEQPPVAVAGLGDRLQQILTTEGEQLVLASTYRQLSGLETQAKAQLNQRRRAKAMPAIEQSQWLVGAATFANPLPTLDLLAAAAINGQMILDLGNIYQQKFSLDQAQEAAGAMGGLLLKLGLVEFSTQTVGQILKTNVATYAIGGLIQGVSAAYLTRMVGLALVEYFEEQAEFVPVAGGAWNIDRFSAILNRVFQANQRLTLLQEFAQQGLGRLMPNSQPA